MKLETLTIPKEQAAEKWKEAIHAERRARDEATQKAMRDLKVVYHRIKKGKGIVDVFQAFKAAGLKEDGNPVLAIAAFGCKTGHCQKQLDGSAGFSGDRRRTSLYKASFAQTVLLPKGTFAWPDIMKNWWQNNRIQTPAPIVPPKLVPKSGGVYFVLWEVEEWKPEPPRDPVLLKRLTNNLFSVEGAWDLTEIERAVIRGRL